MSKREHVHTFGEWRRAVLWGLFLGVNLSSTVLLLGLAPAWLPEIIERMEEDVQDPNGTAAERKMNEHNLWLYEEMIVPMAPSMGRLAFGFYVAGILWCLRLVSGRPQKQKGHPT